MHPSWGPCQYYITRTIIIYYDFLNAKYNVVYIISSNQTPINTSFGKHKIPFELHYRLLNRTWSISTSQLGRDKDGPIFQTISIPSVCMFMSVVGPYLYNGSSNMYAGETAYLPVYHDWFQFQRVVRCVASGLNQRIALVFDKRLSSSPAKMPVKFHSDQHITQGVESSKVLTTRCLIGCYSAVQKVTISARFRKSLMPLRITFDLRNHFWNNQQERLL